MDKQALASLAFTSVLCGALLAQQPRPDQPPVTRHQHDLDSSYIRMPLPPGEQIYGSLDGARMKQFVDEITAISRQNRDSGARYWGRIAGTPSTAMTARLMAQKLHGFGLADVHVQPLDLPPQWFPLSWDVTASGGGTTLTFKTIQPATRSVPTPPGGLTLDAVWVGLGTALDFAGRDVTGKLAIIHSVPQPSGFQHTAAFEGAVQRAAEKGAAAVLVNVAIPGNYVNQIAAAPNVPTFAIGSEDAASLRALMTTGPVTVRADLRTEMRSGLRDANVWGTLAGTTDETIMVIAHTDGYFEAAFDNASGLAVLLGLAEHFVKRPPAERRRGLTFVATGAHHAGSPGTRWLHDNRATALAKTVLILNCEHTSITETYAFGAALRRSNSITARRWWVHGSDRLASLALNAFKTFGVTLFEGMEPAASGDMSAVSRDLPTLQLIVSPVYYHSDHDRPEIVPAAGLEAVARAYAKIIDQVNTLDRSALAYGASR